jgi:hypothetical protein
MTDDSTLYSLGSWYWSTTTLTLACSSSIFLLLHLEINGQISK